MNRLKQYATTREILQQPRLWQETLKIIQNNQLRIREFLFRASQHGELKVILAGAGSSSFVGKSVALYLNRVVDYSVEAIATTDIVSNPENYFDPATPTLLVSYARSGNSPESIATANLAKQLISNFYHLVITCDSQGSLARTAETEDNTLVLLMPEDANDKGFAMTGSFTTMAMASLLLFNLDNLTTLARDVELVSSLGEKLINEKFGQIEEIAKRDFQRAVYLGSSTLYGLAKESALKMLELCGGQMVVSADSSLGFRHGPKSVLNCGTNVFSFLSQDSYTRKYELDLLQELAREKGTTTVVVSVEHYSEADQYVDHAVFLSHSSVELSDDVFLLFPYVLFAQILALLKSVSFDINPDNPSPDGKVNRVVKGVRIYPFSSGSVMIEGNPK